MAVIDDRLEGALEEYVRRYARRARVDMTTALTGFTSLAVEYIAGVDHAGVTLVTNGGIMRCLAATDGHPLVLDNIQRTYGQGPCLDAAAGQQTFRIDDMASEERWPAFAAKAVACTPVRSVLAYPVFTDGSTYAALNLYADRTGRLDARAEAEGALIASRISSFLKADRVRTRPVRSSRSDVIAAAKTLLMRRFSIDVAQAFALLVKLAKQENDSIEAVARTLVSGNS
ncbi:transcriptional regulator [Mycolicibacterium litorale]|uniref:Transcriptional regulator n=1 Tax=Mycolicibacterium litorale TaxID=758802 RepID=A0A6S6NXC4_9MYCO|nr:GAF and ANTAR domain-containing protein [Mycolicibacterium litorale]BCI51014.1 transcriptional regulator [Mycolicibacterium litorale]